MTNQGKESNLKIDHKGNKTWYNEKGQYHREDGPAFENIYGDKYWYINGKLHRENGPAIEWSDGIKAWYFNGLKHRLNGPAYEDNKSKYKEWWYHDKKINCQSQEEFERIIQLLAFE